MKKLYILLTFITFISMHLIATNENDLEECIPEKLPDMKERQFSKEFVGTFNGKKLTYTASLKEKILYEKDSQIYQWHPSFILNI